MIHILTEDSKDGFTVCKLIKQLYFDDLFSDICIDTLNGIWNLKDKLDKLVTNMCDTDTIVIVYDDIKENPLIDKNINEATEYIKLKKLHERIIWIPTNSFEIEVLLILGIELFGNIKTYSMYFSNLRSKFTGDIAEITKLSKEDTIYDDMYNRVKSEKLKRLIYQKLSQHDFERSITIETISKDILKEVFRDVKIDKPMGDCWRKNCCHRKNECNNGYIDFDKIKKMQSIYDLYKVHFIISNTSYIKLVDCISNLKNTNIPKINVSISDIISEQILNSYYINQEVTQ